MHRQPLSISDLTAETESSHRDLFHPLHNEDETIEQLNQSDADKIAKLLKKEVQIQYHPESLAMISLPNSTSPNSRQAILEAGYVMDDNNNIIGRAPATPAAENKKTFSPTHDKATLHVARKNTMLDQLKTTFAPTEPTEAEIDEILFTSGLGENVQRSEALQPYTRKGHYPIEITLEKPITLGEFYFCILKNFQKSNYQASISDKLNIITIIYDPTLEALATQATTQDKKKTLSKELKDELHAFISKLNKETDFCVFNRKRKEKKLAALRYLRDCILENIHNQSLEDIVKDVISTSRLVNQGKDVILEGFFSFKHFGSNRTENLLTRICGGKDKFKAILKDLEPKRAPQASA